MVSDISLPSRLIVAVDTAFTTSDPSREAMVFLLRFLEQISGTGVVVKLNTILRVLGLEAYGHARQREVGVFADLKLVDIPNTLSNDGGALVSSKPEMLTVMCNAGIPAMVALRSALPHTKVLGVTALTSLGDSQCQLIFGCSAEAAVLKFARMAYLAKIGGLILSPKEAGFLR